MDESLFVYGTLTEPEVRRRVIGRQVDGIPDILDGFHKSEIDLGGRRYPIVLEAPGHEVVGLVLNVTAREVDRIDDYETNAYRRRVVHLRSGRRAWVYAK